MNENIDVSLANTCKDFKKEISNFSASGYNKIEFIKNVKLAIKRAEKLDLDPEHYYPSNKRSKIYKLLKAMIKFSSQNDFDDFINKKLDMLKK
jgi:hypothetical protein